MAEGGRNIPESLMCPICRDIFCRATLLPCGHTFCLECLRLLVQVKLKNKERERGRQQQHTDQHPNSIGKLPCPVCRSVYSFPSTGVEGLSRNIIVNSLVDDFLQMKFPPLAPQVIQPAFGKGTAAALGNINATHTRELAPQDDIANTGQSSPHRDNVAHDHATALQRNQTMDMLSTIELPGGVRGLTVVSPDSVAVGYGSSMDGADCCTVSGHRTPFLPPKVGAVRDLTILSNGWVVVSNGAHAIEVYDRDGQNHAALRMDSGKSNQNQYKLWSDKNDLVYAVNKQSEIYVFQLGENSPSRTIKTGCFKPWQVCTTSTGIAIISSYNRLQKKPSTISFFDQRGWEGKCIECSDANEFLFAAVDSKDRVFVATIRPMTGSFRLSVYEVDGLQLKLREQYEELFLAPTKSVWHYMVCLSPQLIALATLANKLYFIGIP